MNLKVANAVGAALSQVSGVRDTVVSLDQTTREAALEGAKQQATLVAIEHGAQPDSVKVRICSLSSGGVVAVNNNNLCSAFYNNISTHFTIVPWSLGQYYSCNIS